MDKEGKPTKTYWGTSCPSYGSWFALDELELAKIHTWLMNNCFIMLDDQVWKQQLGIPMGFSCSPLWCNVYLMHYEISFVQRLAKLGRSDLLHKFQYAYRYIDDLCWLNTSCPLDFLCPKQICSLDNPFWIYPLDVLEIKNKVSKYSLRDTSIGIQASFMNLEMMDMELLTIVNMTSAGASHSPILNTLSSVQTVL